jgi:hypothetical protein
METFANVSIGILESGRLASFSSK